MEILSPASNLEHIKVAIDGKANAVYGGVKKWNARNKAINFTDDEYNFIIDELHKNGIKFYLTLNILLLDEEIEEIVKFLKKNKLPDSFIVTDIGLIQRLKKEFPNVPLHFSTQFGCHNIDDVNYIESLGGERAILARELTKTEIDRIKKNSNIELECFIWGSQCLSFSGLCFFGSLINCGGGNRGKCIITCRDLYSIYDEKGHYLYVPDMDAINMINQLDDINCLKIEGRRRKPEEIKEVLNNIIDKKNSKMNKGYLFGESIDQNGLYEKINTRSKYICNANEIRNINDNDICVEFKNDIPIKFSKNYNNPNVKYLYSEIKKDYDIHKKNINIEIKNQNGYINEILYVNYKGDGNTFVSECNDFIKFDFHCFFKFFKKNKNINLYKIKYIKCEKDEYYISEKLLNDFVSYVLKDCEEKDYKFKKNNLKLKKIFVEVRNENFINDLIDDSFVKIVYDIETIAKLKNIKKVIEKYGNRIIYKLPLFNFKSDNVKSYLRLLENKDVMFTRLTQLYISKDISFKNKYVDYTIYVWNKFTLDYLKKYNVNCYTSSPELSFKRNKYIFGKEQMQFIVCGKLPLVYTRGCFGHLFGCKCNFQKNKLIKNVDKNLNFEIKCNSDYRYILNSDPILNDYSKFDICSNMSFRFVTNDMNINDIKNTIECFKKHNYYHNIKKIKYFKDSYECNLVEGKE